MEPLVYVNGEIVPYSEAKTSVEDRGYQFADGIYEVIRVYNGRQFEADAHFARLRRSAAFLEIPMEGQVEKIKAAANELLRRQQLTEATIYIQVTRGCHPRQHGFPAAELEPSVVVICRPAKPSSREMLEKGAGAITVSDDRWAHVDIKTVGLLPNGLARQKAVRAGAFEAIFIRDGFLTEASSCNVFVVRDGVLITPPKTNYILHGITRKVLLELAVELGIEAREEPVTESELATADEVIVSGTNSEVVPIVTLNGKPVGAGRPGPITRRILAAFQARTRGEPVTVSA